MTLENFTGFALFTAPFCSPCQEFTPLLTQFCTDHGVLLELVNVEEDQGLTNVFGVTGIPTLAVVKDGSLLQSAVGLQNESQLTSLHQTLTESV